MITTLHEKTLQRRRRKKEEKKKDQRMHVGTKKHRNGDHHPDLHLLLCRLYGLSFLLLIMAVASTRATDMSVSSSPAASGSCISSVLSFSVSLDISLVGIADDSNTTKKFPVRQQASLESCSKTCPHLQQLVGSVTSERFHVPSPPVRTPSASSSTTASLK